MIKFAIALLRRPSPNLYSHACSPSLFLNTLAPGEGGSPSPDDAAEVGVWNLNALPAATSPKARKLKAGSLPVQISTANALHAEIATAIAVEKAKARPKALHAEIATAIAAEKAKTRPKAPGRAKGKAKANVELGHIVVGANESELIEIRAFKAEDVEEDTAAQNIATKKAEEAAFHAKARVKEEKSVTQRAEQVALPVNANESTMYARQELSEFLANLDLNSYKCGQRWEETAYKLLDYGISAAHVMKMLAKCKNLSCGRSPDSTLKHFTMLGMSHEQIGHVIYRLPSIFCISSNMFQSKVEFFESVGFDGHSFGKVMLAMTRSLSSLRGRCDFWKEYFQDVDVNAWHTFILKCPKVLTWDLEKTVKPKIEYLEKQGCSKKILLLHPSILCISLEVIASKIKLMEEFGMSSPRSRINLLAMLHWISTPKLYARLHNMLALGFSFDQVQNLMVKHPQLLSYREERINTRLSYAVYVMNLSLDTLAAFSAFWSCSFEKRIKFRYEVVQELISLGAYEKNISMGYMLCMKEARFSRKFVERLQACTEHSKI